MSSPCLRLSAVQLLTSAALAVAGFQPAFAGGPDVSPPALILAGHTDLPGYSGDFDHFGIDTKGRRLFLAAEDHDTLEVFDLDTGAHEKTVTGFTTPHSIFLTPDPKRMLVIAGGAGGAKVLDTITLEIKGGLNLPPGADSIGYDAPRNRLYVVTGGKDVPMAISYVSEIDPVTGEHIRDIEFDANHVEAMAVEQDGGRLFVNVTDKNTLAVIDKAKGEIIAQWPFKEAQENACVAYDEKTRRLFVVARKPGVMAVLNADTGATVASFKAPARTDQVIWDAANRRVYATGGEGYIGVYQQDDADHYEMLADIPSAPGAKTSILSPTQHRLFVAASPGDTKAVAKVMWYDVRPRP